MSANSKHPNVLIIGASRGLGYAIAEEYVRCGSQVVATVRGENRTQLHALEETAGDQLEIEQLDINFPDQIHELRRRIGTRIFDLLLVNAGVAVADTVAQVSTEDFDRVMVTNALSPLRVVETLGDAVAVDGTIAVMSSGQGSISNNLGGGAEIYRASKSALNQLMRSYSARTEWKSRSLLLLAPGWVKTDLGGPNARLTIEESIPSLVRVIDAQRGSSGLQFLDYQGNVVPW